MPPSGGIQPIAVSAFDFPAKITLEDNINFNMSLLGAKDIGILILQYLIDPCEGEDTRQPTSSVLYLYHLYGLSFTIAMLSPFDETKVFFGIRSGQNDSRWPSGLISTEEKENE